MSTLYNRQDHYFKLLQTNCQKDLLYYDYIQVNNYICKVPKNNIVMLAHLDSRIILIYKVLNQYLLSLVRLDYHSYHYIYSH